ncbi:hypothetical protein AAK873_13015 [Heminiphilus faecis]|uniref:Uncharacterized protein n=1 Tax=Heminiphilus faecis TaxID=2601703 RepID=A0ABV4CYN8_9BACT|nr:hypothetical protein [Heminiphilus faecis]
MPLKPEEQFRAILLDVLIDNFDGECFEKTDSRFDIWLDDKNCFEVVKGTEQRVFVMKDSTQY